MSLVPEGMMDQQLQRLVEAVSEIGAAPRYYYYMTEHRNDSVNLSRRVKLLGPLFEEVRSDSGDRRLPHGASSGFQALDTALRAARDLLLGYTKDVNATFSSVNLEIARALDRLPYKLLDLSEEVYEQVELVHAQFKRAGSPSSTTTTGSVDVKEKKTWSCEDTTSLLSSSGLETESSATGGTTISPEVPADFLCPISLELMKDPVIVATGQTYERASIQRWLDAGHKTCPKTREVLPHTMLTPNYVLRALIAQWRGERVSVTVHATLERLKSGSTEQTRMAACEVRMLAKRSTDTSLKIAQAGGIELLIKLLGSEDTETQEHAVTALHNLSIHRSENKLDIVRAGALAPLVELVRAGRSVEGRENAVATLKNLSVVKENKVRMGETPGAIPALVEALETGSARGKQDAALALFSLLIYKRNRCRALSSGVVSVVVRRILGAEEEEDERVNELMAILAQLVTAEGGVVEVGKEKEIVPLMLKLIGSGSLAGTRAVCVLHALCTSEAGHVEEICVQDGGRQTLETLASSGTSKARCMGFALLQLLNNATNKKE